MESFTTGSTGINFDTGTAGTVYLVGAGPGDPDLLTLKAVQAIGLADVILLDDLVNPAVLRHSRPEARIVPVGKRGGCRSTPQAFIERLMMAEAKAGRCVVRLKGGDPFIFGRGGEERAHLQAHGIPVVVVNGISSGLAAPSSIGVPLTHRDCTQGVVFVTGHSQTDDSQPDWRLLAQLDMTLVIYMGIARCADIRAALIAGGKPASTPVAVIRAATTPRAMHLVTTLGDMDADIRREGIASPAIIVIGDVVRFADTHWTGAQFAETETHLESMAATGMAIEAAKQTTSARRYPECVGTFPSEALSSGG